MNILVILKNDICKKKLCKDNGIKLIEIPQIFDLIKPHDFPLILIEKFKEHNIKCYNKSKLMDTKISRNYLK